MMHNLPAILSGQQGGAPFNPETDITWHSLFWAEGTDFATQSYSDGATVGTWPNETGESDATQATEANKPLYDESHASFNNQPVVDFDGTDDYLQSAAFSVNPSYTSGVSVVVIAKLDSIAAAGIAFTGITGSARQRVSTKTSPLDWRINAGSNVDGGTPNTSPHLLVAQFDGSTGNDTLDIDGTNILNGAAGSETLTGVTLGARYNQAIYWNGQIAFAGVYEGDVTADGSWSDFTAWVDSHYGITIT